MTEPEQGAVRAAWPRPPLVEGESAEDRRLRLKREQEARRRARRRDDVLEQKRAEQKRNREAYAERTRQWRAANPDKLAEQQARVDPVKTAARRAAAKKVPLGPCSVCGTTEDVHRHHPDYARPLDVVLLCRRHHNEEHGHG